MKVSKAFLFFAATILLINIIMDTAQATHVNCGDTLANSTTLDSNLTCPGNGLTMGASNIILDCSGHSITGNFSGSGIISSGLNNITIRNCSVSGFLTGVSFQSVSRSSVQNNDIFDNLFTGLSLISSARIRIINNDIFGNGVGLELSNGFFGLPSSNNTVKGNRIFSNFLGVTAFISAANNITDNFVEKNSEGIRLFRSSGNLIFNNLFNNTNNAFDDRTNFWNIPKTPGTNIIGGAFLGGNFWHDYTGVDTTGDGLGDTLLPYNSSGGIQSGGDFLPLVKEGNNPPVLQPIGNKTVNENSTLLIQLNATDPDGDILTFGTDADSVLPSPFTFNPVTGLFTWTPTFADAGSYSVLFNVTDSQLKDEETITITVNNVNRPPEITSIPNTTAVIKQLYIYDVEAFDPDFDLINYSLLAFPEGMTINSTTGLIKWIPGVQPPSPSFGNKTKEDKLGYKVDVSVHASDIFEASDMQNYTITVGLGKK